MFQEQRGWRAIAIRAITALIIIPTLYVFAMLAGDYLPSLGLPPCESRTDLMVVGHGAEAVLLAVSIWLQIRTYRRPTWAKLIYAILMLTGTGLVQEIANRHDAFRQHKCEARSLNEAMNVCAANPAFYRRGKDHYGYDTVTLIAPGDTDKAWSCLETWKYYNGSVSFIIDESVYRAYRKAHSKAP